MKYQMKHIFKTIALSGALFGFANAEESCFSNEAYYQFLVDGSGSVGSQGFETERNFVQEAVSNYIDPTADLGLVRFATGVDALHSLGDDQTRSAFQDNLAAMSFTGGFTNTPLALEVAIQEFEDFSGEDDQRVVYLITDGNPLGRNPSTGQIEALEVCHLRADLEAANVRVYIIGINENGGFNSEKVECLVQNPAQDMIVVENFNDLNASVFATQLNPSDRDQDLVPDCSEEDGDLDNDGIANIDDPDDDGDGMNTKQEDLNGDFDPTNDDTDEDGIPNYLDNDDDNDGILSIEEDANQNGDLTDDDFDGDGIPDYLDEDQNNEVPVAHAGIRDIVFGTITLDASASTDDGTIVSFTWTLTNQDDATIVYTTSGETPTVTGLVKGWYDATVTVEDDFGATAEATILVAAAGPGYTDAEVQALLTTEINKITTIKDAEISALQNQLAICNQKVLELQNALNNANLLLIEKDNTINSLLTTITDLQNQLDQQALLIADLQAQLAEKDAQIATLQQQNNALTLQLQAANLTIEQQNALISEQQITIASLEAQIVEKDALLAEKDAQIALLQSQLDACELALEAALQTIKDKDTEISNLQTQISNLQQEIIKLQIELENALISTWEPGKLYTKGQKVKFEGQSCEVTHHSNIGWEYMQPTHPVLWAVWSCSFL